MSKTPERTTISFPPDCGLDVDDVDKLVEQSDCESRSEYVRSLILENVDPDEV